MVGLGTLGRNAAGGRLRIAVRSQKQKLSAKTQKRAKQYASHGAAGAVSGLSSSLAFTPVQVQNIVLLPDSILRFCRLAVPACPRPLALDTKPDCHSFDTADLQCESLT